VPRVTETVVAGPVLSIVTVAVPSSAVLPTLSVARTASVYVPSGG
jgi:hypothetical protein